LLDPHLSIQSQTIPFIGSGSIKFLGMTIQVPANQSETKIALKANLERMLKAVDAAPVTRRQKLRLYKAGICPRLTWLLARGNSYKICEEVGGSSQVSQYSSPIPSPENEWLEPTVPVGPSQAAPSLKTVPATDIS